MGKSKSIEELEAADKKFENYLDGKRKEIEARQSETRAKMDADIEKFYREGGWDDRKPVMSASYVDVQNMSEWSLGNVNKILSAVEGAIFGSSNPPPGTAIDSDITSNPVIQKIPSLQLLVMARAFTAIQGILEAFTMKSSTNITMLHKVEVASPGLTIFVYVNSNSFRQQSFFNNDLITQYFFMADAYSSAKQLGDYTNFEDLRLFEEEKENLRKIARNLISVMSEATELTQIDALSRQLDGIYDRLEQITERINDLIGQERKSMLGVAQQVRLRKSLMLSV